MSDLAKGDRQNQPLIVDAVLIAEAKTTLFLVGQMWYLYA